MGITLDTCIGSADFKVKKLKVFIFVFKYIFLWYKNMSFE